jgi:hypothetical protein
VALGELELEHYFAMILTTNYANHTNKHVVCISARAAVAILVGVQTIVSDFQEIHQAIAFTCTNLDCV